MAYVVAPPEIHSLAVSGSTDRFPVNRIYCVGRNYEAHIREQGKDPEKEPPFFFMKPASALLPVASEVAELPYPPETVDYQHEIELVVAIGQGGRDIPRETALKHVWGYAVGLDMTRRDLQVASRNIGRPWEFGKSFSPSAPTGELVPVANLGHPTSGYIRVSVNGINRQTGDLAEMIWPVDAIIAELSRYDRLFPGDMIMTGTPAGVAPVVPGDVMHGEIEGLPSIRVLVTDTGI